MTNIDKYICRNRQLAH